MRSGVLLLALVLAAPVAAAAQFPASVHGSVVDGATGLPVDGAFVSVQDRSAVTSADGRFAIARLLPGAHALHVQRLGYRDTALIVELANAAAARVHVELEAVAIPLAPIEVVAARASEITSVSRAEIEHSGARTLADIVAHAPGAVVRGSGPGGATVSIRGSAPEAVLVLVDGVPLNDGLSGVADLSRIPAERIESVRIVPGAQSVRYGPGAQAGVVLVTLRRAASPMGMSAELGSFGAAALGVHAGAPRWSAGATFRRADGAFAYERPPEIGGGTDTRENGDLRELTVDASASLPIAGGATDLRVGASSLERGVPGRSFAPTPSARQEIDAAHAAVRWSGERLRVDAHAAFERSAFADSAPPFGPPVEERARLFGAGLDAQLPRLPIGALLHASAGASLRTQRISATPLTGGAARRTDAGAFVGVLLNPGAPLRAELVVRADHLAPERTTHFTHALTLAAPLGPLQLTAAYRSALRPPALADQRFREGVGVVANPDLRAERIPAELEFGATTSLDRRVVRTRFGASAYAGDVRDMIVWLPDFRFVWSPRNVDVVRRGVESWVELDMPAFALALSGAFAWNHTAYDRPGRAIQLAYRPRHTARASIEWTPQPWRLSFDARWTGARFPAAAEVNRLPPFWTTSAAVARDWRVGGWSAATSLRVDRVFDEAASLIYGVPEPGRTLRFGIRVSRAPSTGPVP